MYDHTWLIFIFLVEMGFYHIGQSGLELLGSSDLPSLTSQSAEIIGMSHVFYMIFHILLDTGLLSSEKETIHLSLLFHETQTSPVLCDPLLASVTGFAAVS